MSEIEQWNSWLMSEDSVNALAQEGYDDAAAAIRVKALWHRLTDALG